jgi:hypothetical protein
MYSTVVSALELFGWLGVGVGLPLYFYTISLMLEEYISYEEIICSWIKYDTLCVVTAD